MAAVMSQRIVIKPIDELIDETVKLCKDIITQSIDTSGRCIIALSGGSTPKLLFPKLVGIQHEIPWEKVNIFFVDERFVPFVDADNNYCMIKEALLDKLAIPPKNIHPISTHEYSPEISAHKYEQFIRRYFKIKDNEFPRFDLVMLGLGADGHTASLFPGTDALNEQERVVVAVRQEKLKHHRISLTFPAINNAHHIHFLITGNTKAAVLREILEKKNALLPAARIVPHEGTLYFFIDEDAGSLIKK